MTGYDIDGMNKGRDLEDAETRDSLRGCISVVVYMLITILLAIIIAKLAPHH